MKILCIFLAMFFIVSMVGCDVEDTTSGQKKRLQKKRLSHYGTGDVAADLKHAQNILVGLRAGEIPLDTAREQLKGYEAPAVAGTLIMIAKQAAVDTIEAEKNVNRRRDALRMLEERSEVAGILGLEGASEEEVAREILKLYPTAEMLEEKRSAEALSLLKSLALRDLEKHFEDAKPAFEVCDSVANGVTSIDDAASWMDNNESKLFWIQIAITDAELNGKLSPETAQQFLSALGKTNP